MEPISYDQFRTGLSYAVVYEMLWDRKYKRRSGVLGYWRQLKKEAYEEYLRRFYLELAAAAAAEPPPAPSQIAPEPRVAPAPTSLEAWRASRVKRRLTPARRAA